MGTLIDFEDFRPEEPDIDTMDRSALHAYLEQLRARIAALDETEPKNMNSEAYEEWGRLHEELEDLADDVLDRLDELEQ